MSAYFRTIIAVLILLVPGQHIVTFEEYDEIYFTFDKKLHHHLLHVDDDELHHVVFNIYKMSYKKYFSATLSFTGSLSADVTRANGKTEHIDLN